MKKLIALLLLTACCRPISPPTIETIQQIEENRNATYTAKEIPAHSQFGIDYPGIARMCDAAIRYTPAGWAIGGFADSTFGQDSPGCFKRLCDNHRFADIRAHTHWDNSHGCASGGIESSQKAAAALDPIARNCGGKLEISGWCENQCGVADAEKMRSQDLHACPHCDQPYVHSPEHGVFLPDSINEVHGSNPPKPPGRFYISGDGSSSFDMDIEAVKKKYAGAETFFFWSPCGNGRRGVDDKTSPAQRTGWCSPDEIRALADLAVTTIPAPKLPPGWTYKSVSETWGSGRGHPVLIIPAGNQAVKLVAANGRPVATFGYAGAFAGGGFRYYGPDWGYKLAAEAVRVSGQRQTWLQVGSRRYGPIDPNRRAGTFR